MKKKKPFLNVRYKILGRSLPTKKIRSFNNIIILKLYTILSHQDFEDSHELKFKNVN